MAKRILHIIPSLGSGGAERQLANLISKSSADEFVHIVCAFRDSEFFAPVIREAGYQVHQLNVFGRHPWFSATSKLHSFIGIYKPDLIKTWLYDANIAGRLARMRNFGIPLVTTLHSPDYGWETIRANNWSPLKVEGLRWIDKLTASLTNPYFVAVSDFVKESYMNHLNIADSRIKVIYNGVDPDSIKSTEADTQNLRQELGVPTDAFVYITVGRLDAAKNHRCLLKAFSRVLAEVPQAYLVIVGTGVLEQELKNAADSLGIMHRVRFLGRRDDIGTCLNIADVFVFPTLFEGFGIALVEAMFKKLPCVASDLKVLREIVTHEETALLFNPNSTEELTSAMSLMFSQPQLRRRLAEQGLKVAAKRFHIRVAVAEWENFYRCIIKTAGEK